MAGLGTGAPIVKVYHEKSMILPDVSRVLACLYEKDIDFQRHTASYKSLLRLQASSHAPVPFYDGLTFLEESREICRYIAETYEHRGYPYLLGKDSLERASIEQWLHHEEHTFNPPSRSLFCHLAFPPAQEDDDIDLQKRKLEEVLEVYEQRLGDSEFLAGNKFTLADLVHLPNSQYITDSDKFVYLYDSRKNVQRWWNAISTRDSWQKVLKDIQAVEQQRKQEELEKQQQRQWLRKPPKTTRPQIRLDSRKHDITKSQTILVPPPVGIISTFPTAPQTEKPLPTETSLDEPLPSTPIAPKSSSVHSKHTTTSITQRETPPAPVQSTPRLPGYSHIPVQSTSNSFTPATSPTTAENPWRSGADKSKIRGVSLSSEATEIDLPANSKPSSHTDEAEPYIEPTPHKPPEMSSNATDHVKTSPTSAKEDSDASGFWTDNTATNADTQDKKSVRYTDHTPQRPAETIYSRSTEQRVTYTSPGQHGSTEAHQELQSEKWHATAAGLSKLKGETDLEQYNSSQDSEQESTHLLAQEPVSMGRQPVQGPEMTTRKPYTDQKRGVSSMSWQQSADVPGVTEGDRASSEHRDSVLPPYSRKHAGEAKIVSADHREDASLPKRVKDEDTQAAYDDAHDIALEARETASPVKKRYSGGEDTTKQSEDAASRPRRMSAQEVQDNFKETKSADSLSTREPPSSTWRAPPRLPRHQVDDDDSTTVPSQKRYPGTGGTIKELEDNTYMAGEAAKETLEETKFAESASSRAERLYYERTDAPSRKQEAVEDPLGASSPLERRYADSEDTTKHSRDTAFKPSKMVGQDAEDTSEEAEARKSALFRAQPPGGVATTPSKQAAEDDFNVSRSSRKRYPEDEETSKQPRESVSMPTNLAAQDGRDVFRESKVADSTPSIQQPSDARAPVSFQKQEVPDASSQKRYPDAKGPTKKSKVTFEDTKSSHSASSQMQPSDSQRDYSPSWKIEEPEPPRATSQFKKRHSDDEDTSEQSVANAFQPRQIVGQDTQGTYEETKASDFRLHREQSQAAATPTEKVATEDSPGVIPPSERDARSDEDTTTRPSGTASAPRRTIAGDASGTFQESKPADSVSSREQPLSARQPVVTPSRQETEDSLSKISAFHKTRPFVEDSARPAVDTDFGPRQIGADDAKSITEETKVADSAPSVRARPTYTPRTARPPSEQAEVVEDARDKDREGRETFSATKKMVSRDAEDTYGEREIPNSAFTERSLDNLQASSPIKQAAAEDPRGATRGDKEWLIDEPKKPQAVKGTSKKSVGTFEETKGPGSTLPTGSAQDAQRTDRSSRTPTADQRKDGPTQLQSNLQYTYKETKSSSAHQKILGSSPSHAEAGDDDQPITGEKIISPEQPRKMLKESQSASSKAQPADSRSPIKVERTTSVYQEDHLVAPYSREQPQTLQPGVRADGSTPKRQQAPVAPSTSEEKSTPPTPPRAEVHDDHTTAESKVADSTPSIQQPSDARAPVSFQKQEVPDASPQKRYPDAKGPTKKSKVTFEDTKSPDSASSRVQPSDSQRDYAPSLKKEATEPPRATSQFKKRHSDDEDTAEHSVANAFKPRQMVGQDTQGTHEEAKASDSGLHRELSSDTWQAATTPTEKLATEDSPGVIPPSERDARSDEDTTTRPSGTASAPRRTTAGDASGTFEDSKPADSVSSREKPLSARQPVVTPSRQETEDSLSKISAFHKTRPFVEDSTRPAVDTDFGPRQIGAENAEDITEETKVADSAPSVRARPTYTPRTARPPSEQAEVVEDARDKDREGRETFSATKKMVSRDAEDTYGEREIPNSASTEGSLDNLQASSPIKQAAAEDPRGATRGDKEWLIDEPKKPQAVKGTSKKSVGTFEETKGPGSALPTGSAQDAQRTDRSSRTPTADQRKDGPTQLQSNLQDTYKETKSSSAHQKILGSSPSHAEAGDDDQPIRGEKIISPEQPRKMLKESQSASSKAQPADSRSPIKVERTTSVYQEDHLVAPYSREQPQTLQPGVRADGSTPKRQQAPVAPSTSEEKSTPPTLPRAKVHDDHTTAEPFRRDTGDDPKGAPHLLGQEPTSRVQPATELTPDGDRSSKPSSIAQWQRTSAPIQGLTSKSGDDVLGVSTIDQKPTPMGQQSRPSQGANEMVKREQRMVPSAPARAQAPDVQHAPPSFARADMAERDGEPVQMQAPTQHPRPTSVPTRRAAPDDRDTGDKEFFNTSDVERWKALKAKHDSAMIDEDVRDASLSTHDATGDSKTTRHASEAQVSDTLPGSTATPVNVRPTSGDEVVQRFSREQEAKPSESTQAQTPPDPPRDSVSTRGVPSDALDKTKFVKPSSTEDMRPTAGPASAFEAQLAEHKFVPSDKKSAGAAQPLSSVESMKEDTSVSAADQTKKPQTIFRQESRPSTPITKQVPSSIAYHDTRKIQQSTLDNLPTDDSPTPYVPSDEQVSPQTIPSERDMTPVAGTSDSPASDNQIVSAEAQKAIPDNYRPDELAVPFVPSEKQGSYAGSSTEPYEGPSRDAHGAADDKDITEYPSRKAPVIEYRPDSTAADSYVRPTSGDEPGISLHQGAESPKAAQATNSEDQGNEVYPSQKKFSPSDKDSVHFVQQPSPAETRKRETTVTAAEQTLPIVSQQRTQDMREAPTSDFVPAKDIPSDPQSVRSDKVALAGQKFASSDQDTPLTSSVEPRNEEIRNSTRSAESLFSAVDDQTKDPKTTIGQQDIAPTPGTSKSPSSDTHHASGQFQEIAPDDQHTVEPLPSQGQVSRTKPSLVPSEGPTHDYHSDIDKKTTKLPSSQAQSSDPKPDRTQNRSDGHPTRYVPSQLPKQHEETQTLPPLVGPYDSKPSQDVTSDTLGKVKSLKPSSINQEASSSALTPDAHLGSAPGQVAPAGQKLLFKDQDSAHPTQKSSSSEPPKEQSTVASPNEAKTSPEAPYDSIYAKSASADAFGEAGPVKGTGEVTPADQSIDPSEPPPVVESRKESTGAEAETSRVYQPVTDKKDIRHAPSITERVLDGDHKKEPVSREEQGSHDQRASEPREGSSPDVHGASLDKKTTPPSSQAKSSDPKRDSLSKSVDVNPSNGQQSTARSLPGQGAKLPGLTRSPPLHESLLSPEANEDARKSSKPTSANQEVVTSPKEVPAPAPNTLLGTASDEIAPDGQNFPLSAQDLARSAQQPFSVEPTKEKGIFASSDQTKEARKIIGQQGATPSTDKEKAPFNLQSSELAKTPNEDQEQVHAGSAYEQREGPTRDTRGAVDEKMPHPSSQAEKSDIVPDSAPISGDAHRTSVDGPIISSRDSEAQPPTGTQIVPALFVENIESPTPPSTDQEFMTPMTSPTPAPEALKDQDLTSSSELSPSVVSRNDAADQTNVVEAGLREPTSSDSKRPSKKIQEFSPDDYLTKSEKSILPLKGADEKTTMIKGDQANTIPNASISASQAVQGPLSEESLSSFSQKNLERTSPEENSKQQQQQIDQSSTRSSKDDRIEARGTANPNILTRSGDIQQSAVKESMEEAQGSRNQQQADQAFFQSTQENEMQLEETEAQGNRSEKPEEIRPGSAPISGTSSDGPATNSVRASLSQPPAETQNVPAVLLEKTESPRRPSADQELMSPMTSSAPAPDSPQADEDTTQSPQLSPSVVSRKDVADTNQTDAPQADLRVPRSSDATLPSRKVQEFSPVSSVTKSAKPLPSGDMQPSPPKQSMQATQGSRNQQQAGQAVSQSIQDNEKQIEETEAQDKGSEEPKEIRADSAPISGDALRTSDDGPATSSVRDSPAQPPAGTLNVPAVFLENVESPRPPSTDQEPVTPTTSLAPAPDAPQDQDSTQSPQLSPSVVSMTDVANADQTNVPEAGLREPASSDVARPSADTQKFSPSQKNLEGILPEEKSNQQQQTVQSNTRSSEDDSIEASGTTKPDISTSGDTQPSARKGRMQGAEGSRNQQKADQDVLESTLDNEKQFVETEARDVEPVGLDETNLQQSTNQKNNGASQMDALEQPEKRLPAVQPWSNDTSTGSKPTKDAPRSFQGENKSESTSRTSEEPKLQVRTEDKTQGGESMAPAPEIEQPDERDLPSINKGIIRPDSAPITGTSSDGKAASSLRDSQSQPPAGAMNVPAVFLEKIESPRRPSTDEKLVKPMTTSTPAPDVPQDQDSTRSPQLSPSVVSRKDVAGPSEKTQEFSPDTYLAKSEKPQIPMEGSNPVLTSNEESNDLSSNEKSTMIKGEQANTISNGSLSANQPIGQAENSAVNGPLSGDVVSSFSEKNLERTLPEEKSKQQQQQQTDQSSPKLSKDDSIEATGTASPNILTTSEDIQPSPHKQNMLAAQGSKNQQQAGQAVFKSIQNNKKQIEEAEAQDNGSDEPSQIRPDSAPISGDARLTSDDGPATSSLRDSRTQPPAGTPNVPAVLLEKMESPRSPSTDQEPMTPMIRPAPAPEAPQDQDSTQSRRLSPSVISRKDVGNANQTNVTQAGLREPASSDATRPSEEIQEFSPDASLTKSAKPLLPMTGRPLISPAQAPDAPQDQDSTQSRQLSPSVISRKDVGNANQTNVTQAGLREPASSDVTRPSEEIQESSPDASLTKSAKPLLPMTGTNTVKPPLEASLDLSGVGEPTTTKGDQANTISNVGFSVSQTVGQSENSEVKRPLSEDFASSFSQTSLEGTSPEEKSNHKQQTGQLNTRSSEDDIIEASGDTKPNIPTSGDIQPSARKERMQGAEGSRNQQQADQDVLESTPDEFIETEAQDVGTIGLDETNLQQSKNLKNDGASQRDAALEQPEERLPAVQPGSNDTSTGSKPAKGAPGSVQAENKSDSSSRTSEEPQQQVQTEGKTQGGESMASAPKIEQPDERDLPSINKGIIRPGSSPVTGTSSDGKAASSLRDSQSQAPAGTMNVPTVFLEKIESPRRPSTDEELVKPMTTSTPAPDVPQDQDSTRSPQLSPSVVSRKDVTGPSEKTQEFSPDTYLAKSEKPQIPMEGSNPVLTSNEESNDLSSNEKSTMIKGEQANTISNGSLSANQPIGQAENSAVNGPLSGDVVSSFSQKNLERTLPEEKSKQQQQTDQSSPKLSKDDSIEATGAASPNILTTSEDIQLSPHKQNMLAAQGSKNQQQAGQAVFKSIQNNKKQIEEAEAQDNGSDEPSQIRPDSAPISGDARLTSDDGPATSSLRDSRTQPPAGTPNVPAVFLEKMESPRSPSTDQEPMTPMIRPAPAPEAPQDQDSTQSRRLSPSVISRKDVGNANQTNVTQAGLREPASSDATRPSEEIQEFSPDASLTKSAKPLLPMTGRPLISPAQAPDAPQDQDSTQSRRLSPSVISRKDVGNANQTNVTQAGLREPASSDVTRPSEEIQESSPDASLTKSAKPLLPMTGANPVQPAQASFDLSSDGKPTKIKGDQANPIPSVSLSASQAVARSENSALKGPLFEETSLQQSRNQKNNGASQRDAPLEQPEEHLTAVQPRSNDTSTGSKPIKGAPGNVQAENKSDSSSRTSEEAEQQVQTEGKTQGGESKAPASEAELLEERDLSSIKKGTTSQSQEDKKSNSSLRTSEEAEQQVQSDGKTQGSETSAPASETEHPEERDRPSSNQGITSQSRAETSGKPEEQASSGIKSRDTETPAKLDGSADDDTKPAGTDDNPPSS